MLYKGSLKTSSIYLGSSKVKEIYKGSDLVYTEHYPIGTVLIYQNTPMGSAQSIILKSKQNIQFELVGPGAGFSGSVHDL